MTLEIHSGFVHTVKCEALMVSVSVPSMHTAGCYGSSQLILPVLVRG